MPPRYLRKTARSARWLAATPDGFWDANTKAVPSWMVTAVSTRKPLPGGHCRPSSRAGAAADRDGQVGLRDRRARVGGGGGLDGRSRVSRQALLRWCCERPCLDAARPVEEVNDAVLVAGGALSVPLLCGLSAGVPARGRRLGVAVVPGGEDAGRGGRAGRRGLRLRGGEHSGQVVTGDAHPARTAAMMRTRRALAFRGSASGAVHRKVRRRRGSRDGALGCRIGGRWHRLAPLSVWLGTVV